MCDNAGMTRKFAILFAISWSLAFFGLAQDEGFEVRGELPAAVPDGTVVEAMIRDAPGSLGTAPLARGRVEGGAFSVRLPAELDSEMLGEMRVCGGSSVNIAFVPYLEVLDGEATLGQFWRTRQAPGDWGMFGPSSYTYLAYVEEPFVAEEDCMGDLIELDLQPGWNLYSRIVTDSGSLTTSAEPPADFVWRFLR